jgi:uncharacterized MAPEG superfamily protein
MNETLFALVAFSAWTLLLVFSLAGLRMLTSQRTGKAINSFLPDGSDMEGLGHRWTRAHLNCVEFLPVFAAVSLAAVAAGRSDVTNGLAMVVLYLRLGQSIVHIASTAVPAVLVRATLFVGQVLIVLNWARQLLFAA